MSLARADDYAVVDGRGNVLFRIKPTVLAGLLCHLKFTRTRRGRNMIRAHKTTAPDLLEQGEGEVNPKGIQK
jgi:GMP synthase-like glutamine amidotransferase